MIGFLKKLIGITPAPIIVTSCYGNRFWAALDPWATHIKALTHCDIEVIALDDHRYKRTSICPKIKFTYASNQADLRYGSGDRFRIERILFHLQRRTCIQVDIDVLMKRDFSVLCHLPYDFIISRAFVFPEFARDKLGFVACTGFYIAKPTARQFCIELLRNIQENTYGSELDQHVLNAMLCVSDSSIREPIQIDNQSLDADVFEVCGCRVAVLPRGIIERTPTPASIFGNHYSSVIDEFIAKNQRPSAI